MIYQGYYRDLKSNYCNFEITDQYLVVNCTGTCSLSTIFTTRSMRKDFYLLYLVKGSLNVWINEEKKTMHEGHLIIFNPNHEYLYQKTDEEEMVYYWVHFSGFGARELLERCRLYNRRILDVGINGQVIHEFNSMFCDFMQRDCFFEISVTAHLIAICTELGRSLTDTTGKHHERVYTSLQYINANYNADIQVKHLAEMEHLSVSRYRTVFKQCMGLSPKEYIMDLRIKIACGLFSGTDLTVKEVAGLVGYHDQLYFSRMFKARTGITPIQYKA